MHCSSPSQESDPSLDSLKSRLKIAQTQTEKKLSFLKQFRYCFFANEQFRYEKFNWVNNIKIVLYIHRKQREKAAAMTGVSFNSVSRIDSCARCLHWSNTLLICIFRLLFPLTFLLFNLTYWTIYFKTARHFSWADHAVRGNLRESWKQVPTAA